MCLNIALGIELYEVRFKIFQSKAVIFNSYFSFPDCNSSSLAFSSEVLPKHSQIMLRCVVQGYSLSGGELEIGQQRESIGMLCKLQHRNRCPYWTFPWLQKKAIH